MNLESKLIPSSSQTVGPFFQIGLQYLIDRAAEMDDHSKECIAIHGRVVDRDGAPVPDAMLEFWTPTRATANGQTNSLERGIPDGFRRVATNIDGDYSIVMRPPVVSDLEDGRTQAPHLLVLVFARGLLHHLISRVYFEGQSTNPTDPVLLSVPAERRHTLVATSDTENSFRWDLILQGPEETVFFAW